MVTKKREEALSFLQEHATGVLATCGTDNQPHASAIFYVADENFNIHFLTLLNSRKYKAMKENPRVAFTAGTMDVPQTIQIEGVAEEILHEREKNEQAAKLIDLLMEHSKRYYAPLIKMDRSEIVLTWIQPKWIRWADYSAMDKTGTENVWTEIPIV
jgi:nitroimidazol reductase NimA-like FMN-containing flavoprotein (pyridoxamine 5'-phosphate oxidase superfamily)